MYIRFTGVSSRPPDRDSRTEWRYTRIKSILVPRPGCPPASGATDLPIPTHFFVPQANCALVAGRKRRRCQRSSIAHDSLPRSRMGRRHLSPQSTPCVTISPIRPRRNLIKHLYTKHGRRASSPRSQEKRKRKEDVMYNCYGGTAERSLHLHNAPVVASLQKKKGSST